MATLAPAHLAAVREAVLAGDIEAAAVALGPILNGDPANHEARYWLASAMRMAGDVAGAAKALDDARVLHALAFAQQEGLDVSRARQDGDYAAQAASVFYSRHQVVVASVLFGMAISAGSVSQQGLLSYGLSLQHQGRAEESILAFQAALDLYPSPAVHQFLLYPQLLLEDQTRYAEEARRWAALHAPGQATASFANPPAAGRKLRVGYVAPSFSTTQVRQFLAPVLHAHDPNHVEAFLYPATADTEKNWPASISVHPIGHLSDSDAANAIRRDGIDVLADCWGHSAGSRLSMFALRPAPVQVAWINFVQTTGLRQIDYVLHADSGGALNLDGLFVEDVWTIGPVFNTFFPADGRPAPAPTPALARGQVTFGSFNHPCKLSDETLDAWGRILRATPTSRLFLKYRYFADPVLKRVTQARLASMGVAPERIFFEGETKGAEYLSAFANIDLALDTSPAPGSTTTLEALSNGVPVLTMSAVPQTIPGFYARTIVEAAGLPDLVTDSWDSYVLRAIELASDVHALDRLRARVRPGFDNGPLRDDISYTRRLESAFREMFERARSAGWAQHVAA